MIEPSIAEKILAAASVGSGIMYATARVWDIVSRNRHRAEIQAHQAQVDLNTAKITDILDRLTPKG